MVRVYVTPNPKLIKWAVERAGTRADDLYDRFEVDAWQRGANPTIRQLEDFATAARVPFGYLFLDDPPAEELPIADMRTLSGRGVVKPSPELLDTIAICQRRQDWYRDYADGVGQEPCEFIGTATLRDSPVEVAGKMQKLLAFDLDSRRHLNAPDDTMRLFIQKAEGIGVLVMVSSVVGANNQRSLDREEFQGFAISDSLAPLVFVNGADWKAAQVFTLAHELAHLWLGFSALSNAAPDREQTIEAEIWCNAVAAELLVPADQLNAGLRDSDPLDEVRNLSKLFKVSRLVILRRLKDVGQITIEQFRNAYKTESANFTAQAPNARGQFYLSQPYRVSRRFARAIIANTVDGGTLYRDAFQMLGIKKDATFRKFGRTLKVLP